MNRAEILRDSLQTAHWLRATGPQTDEFLRWRDAACETLREMLGLEHASTQALRAAVGPFDDVEAEGLQIHGPDGMLARMDNATPILRALLGEDA